MSSWVTVFPEKISVLNIKRTSLCVQVMLKGTVNDMFHIKHNSLTIAFKWKINISIDVLSLWSKLERETQQEVITLQPSR